MSHTLVFSELENCLYLAQHELQASRDSLCQGICSKFSVIADFPIQEKHI